MFWLENFKDILGLWVFVEENYTPKIVIGVDPSWGVTDYSAIEGLDIKTCKQVLEYRGRVGFSDLLEILKKISLEDSYFQIRCILIEGNLGRDLIDRYEEWVRSLEEDQRVKAPLMYKDQRGENFIITSINRSFLLARVREFLAADPSIVRSPRLYEELNNFILDRRGKETAAPGHHDDLIFAFALALKCREEYILNWAPVEEFREESSREQVIKKYLFPIRGGGSHLDRLIEEFKKLGIDPKSLEIQKFFEEIKEKSREYGRW